MANEPDRGEVTVLLQAWSGGDREAGERLFPLIYRELHRITSIQLGKSPAQITLQATEVLHEAYIRLADQDRSDWKNRAHFYALAATVVRRVLLDHARFRLADRRDRRVEVSIDAEDARGLMSRERADELLRLNDALTALSELDARRARVVELRYFAGLEVKETAEVLQVSPATVKRDWAFARAWLLHRLNPDPETPPDSALQIPEGPPSSSPSPPAP